MPSWRLTQTVSSVLSFSAVRNIRSPNTTGEECPAGNSDFHKKGSSGPIVTGRAFFQDAVPEALGPRNWGHCEAVLGCEGRCLTEIFRKATGSPCPVNPKYPSCIGFERPGGWSELDTVFERSASTIV